MQCPFCNEPDTRVIDSRLASEGNQVRRRRECTACGERFTTYETALLTMPRIVKTDGSREVFDEQKLRDGILLALQKRAVGTDRIESAINKIKRLLGTSGEREVPSMSVGELVMNELRLLDHVAYIRFASVYRSFEDVQAFQDVIDQIGSEPTPEMRRSQLPLIEDEE